MIQLTIFSGKRKLSDEAALQLVSHLCNQYDKDLFIVGSIKKENPKENGCGSEKEKLRQPDEVAVTQAKAAPSMAQEPKHKCKEDFSRLHYICHPDMTQEPKEEGKCVERDSYERQCLLKNGHDGFHKVERREE